MMEIRLDELARQFSEIESEALEAAERVFRSGRYILTQGTEVSTFEAAYASYCDCAFAIGTSSGTSALQLALVAAGIEPGDEVLVPANTYIATAFAVSYTGATPVLVDAEPTTYTIDVEQAAARVTPRTKAIMPVHLYGHPADMDGVRALARDAGLTVIEDAAQAHGASYDDARVGSLGDAAAFSFYPTKNLGALGDAGAITTNDEALRDRARQLRYMGQKVKYYHDTIGYQDRMDELQGALLAVKLRRLDEWNGQRRAQAAQYDELLEGTPLGLPIERERCHHVYHLYVVRAPRRDELQEWLAARGVHSAVFYPKPVHLHGAYAHLGHSAGDFPVAESVAEGTLALPVFPGHSETDIAYVAEQVRGFYERADRRPEGRERAGAADPRA
jgi:dTDP-4-amino-4,6-dideoxygalactose transaminase